MIHKDTKIKLLSGKVLSIEEMFNTNDQYFVYSLDKNLNVYPSEVKSISKVYAYDTYIIPLDCHDYVEVSSDQLFLTRDYHTIPADLLRSGTSLMPMHFKINKESYNHNREMYYDFVSNSYLFIHHMVMNYFEPKNDIGGFDIHHIDENYLNNSPNNLMWLDSDKHKSFHEQERKNKYNAERDKNFSNDLKRNSILASAACLIRKYSLLDKDLINSKHAAGFLRNPINTFFIDKYFESYDEFLRLAYEYEDKLSSQDYKRLTRSADDRKASKKDKMAKIGRLLLDEGKTIDKSNYDAKNYKLHLNAQPFEKIEKYFKTFDNYMRYVNNYNHKTKSATQHHYDERCAMYKIKLKNADNFCIALTNDNYIMLHT